LIDRLATTTTTTMTTTANCCVAVSQLEEEETPGSVRLSKFLPLMTQVLLERRLDLYQKFLICCC